MRSAQPTIRSAAHRPRSTAQMVRHWMDVPVMTVAGYFSIFAVTFGNLVDVEADNDEVSISGQAAIKILMLGIGGLYGGIGFLTDKRVQRLLFSFPVMWMVILFGMYCLSTLASPIPLQSFASTVSIACVLLMTTTALVQFGVRSVLTTVFYAMSLYVVLSWFAFLFVPSIGVFFEETVDAGLVPRMGGLAHPNTLGQVSGMTLVLGLILFQLDSKISKWRIAVLFLAAGALVFSLSRTSLLATIVATAVCYRNHVFRRQNVMLGLGLAVIGLLGLIAASVVFDVESMIASKLGMISKSGDVSELTSATGRTEIWAYVIKLVGESPLLGYGAATSKLYLSEYSLHTHNLILNVALSTGFFGGLIAAWMYLERAIRLFTVRHPVADALVAFVLVNGMFENVIFSILAGAPTLIWVTGLALPLLGDDEANRTLQEKSRREAARLAGRPLPE